MGLINVRFDNLEFPDAKPELSDPRRPTEIIKEFEEEESKTVIMEER